MHSVAETQTAKGQEGGGAAGEGALYLVQLIVFLQDQSDDVTHQGDFPQRETRLEELLLAQHRLVVEHVPQRLREKKTAVLTSTGWEICPSFLQVQHSVACLVKGVGESEVTFASQLESSCHQLLGKRWREGGEGEAHDGEESSGVTLGEAAG